MAQKEEGARLWQTAAEGKNEDADCIVIGGGPGGYTAALRLSMKGKRVVLIERERVGGTCLNRGCIPTKALLHSAEVYELAKSAKLFGVATEGVSVNPAAVEAYKNSVVATLLKGVKGLLTARKVEVITGIASFLNESRVEVKLGDGTTKAFSAPVIIIATGSRTAMPPIPGLNHKNVITSAEALDVATLPVSLAIIGGGVIGMELGAAYAGMGVKVTVIEALDRVLPNMDGEISKAFTRIAKKKMDIYTSARVSEIAGAEGELRAVLFSEGGLSQTITAEKVLIAVGRVPDTEALCLEKAGIAAERGRVLVNDDFETNVPGIYCIGDANGRHMLAHAASAQAAHVAARIFGERPGIKHDIIPGCVYTDPEIACVGMTEEEAKAKGIVYKAGKFNVRANGRSLVLNRPDGFVKIIADEIYGEVLGVHIMGSHATEMIGECAAVMHLEGCVDDIAHIIHAHPSVSESMMEAAESLMSGAIHAL